MSLPIPQSVAEISAAWIEEVLRASGALADGRVAGVEVRPIGEGVGFLSCVAVVGIRYEPAEAKGPATVVVKLEPAAGSFRDTERETQAFTREVDFYRDIAGGVDVRVPRVYYAVAGPEGSALVMEDLSHLESGDQVRGLRHREVIATVEQIGRLHAAYWNDDRLHTFDWLPDHDQMWREGYEEHWPGFVQEFEVRLGDEGRALGERVLHDLEWLTERIAERPSVMIHGDLRADNLMFGDPASGDAVVILDWQLVTRSMAAIDPTRLLGGSEPAAQRRGHHLEVFTAWHESLLRGGVRGYEFEEALDDFRLGALYNLMIPVKAYGFLGGNTSQRVGRLFDAQVDRIYTSAMELEAGQLLPRG
jgi:hypothetical protein